MAYNKYIVVSDAVVAIGDDNSIHCFKNTDYNEETMKLINERKTVVSRLAEHEEIKEDMIEARTGAVSRIAKESGFISLFSLCTCYFCAHMQMVPFNGDVKELLLRTLIPAAIFTGAGLAGSIRQNYAGCTKKDIRRATRAISRDKNTLNSIENRLEDTKLALQFTAEDVEEHAFDGSEVCRKIDTRLDLELAYELYHDQMRKAYCENRLPEFLSKIGVELESIDRDLLLWVIDKFNHELEFNNTYMFDNNNKKNLKK